VDRDCYFSEPNFPTGSDWLRPSDLELHEPTLLFYPRGRTHSFVVDPERGADLVCATVELGGAEGNPIEQGMPKVMKAYAGLYSGVRWKIGWEVCRP
jgi:hypothetical protein